MVKPIFSHISVMREWLGKSWNLPFNAPGCVADVYAGDSAINKNAVGFRPNFGQVIHAWHRRFAAQSLLCHPFQLLP